MAQQNQMNPLVSTAKFGLAVSGGVVTAVSGLVIIIMAIAGWDEVIELSRPFMSVLTITVGLVFIILAVMAIVYLGFIASLRVKKSSAEADTLVAANEKTRADAQKTRAEAGGMDATTQVLQATGIEAKLAEIQRVLAESMAARTVTAPHDYQVHRLSDPAQLKNETSTPLHLQPGRTNGVAGVVDPVAERRWSAFQNSYARRPFGPDSPAVEPAARALLPTVYSMPPGGSATGVILGQYVDKNGALSTLSAPIWELVHIASGGATDSGKSNLLRVIALQMVLSPNVLTAFVDMKMSTFKVFRDAPGNMYPIITTEAEFNAVTAEIYGEARRRVELFSAYPTVETVADYNRLIEEPLPLITVFVDEISNLLDGNAESQKGFLDLVRYCRAAGIYVIAGGQTWDHRTMRTAIRQQFRTAFHFGTNDKRSSHMLLNDSCAAEITQQGRAFASLPFGMTGGQLVEVQTPYLALETARQYLPEPGGRSSAQVKPQPAVVAIAVPTSPEARRAMQLVEVMVRRNRGASWRQVTTHVFGEGKFGSHYNGKVRAWVEEYRPELVERFDDLMRESY
jgi:hypothetical protein